MDSNKKINILFLIDGFNIGGAELNLLEMLRNIDKRKYDITVCSFMDSGPLQPDFKQLGFQVKLILRKWRFDPSIFLKLRSLMKKNSYDIVLTLLFYPDIVGTLIAHSCRVPCILSWATASHYDRDFDPWHRRFFYKIAMKKSNKIIAVSNETKESIIKREKFSPDKILVIPSGLNIDKYSRDVSGMKKVQKNDSLFVIGVVARLNYIKGHVFLIRALKEVKAVFPNFQCRLIGDGEYKPVINELVQKLGLSEHVQFMGFRRDIPEQLKQLDVFVLPSLSEGLPMVILEAMAASVPIVASSVGGIPEVIKNNVNGILVKPGDSESLARGIQSLFASREKREKLAREARNFVEKKFSITTLIKSFEEIFTEYLS